MGCDETYSRPGNLEIMVRRHGDLNGVVSNESRYWKKKVGIRNALNSAFGVSCEARVGVRKRPEPKI